MQAPEPGGAEWLAPPRLGTLGDLPLEVHAVNATAVNTAAVSSPILMAVRSTRMTVTRALHAM
ncbi:hypothetical protein [Rugosimonospora africana]|uniref:Uncharacterized protein n=1 Tax=Rugosimonospora africana TaxID=556532 RepID=A0A8J3QSN0_9ACTN|nr:hypothetical protein [Rugosimonospora africana]GIH16725.1 hypothetical protein Raf01_48970 [Rugosimonospora africana]